jgi:hypothetical protein
LRVLRFALRFLGAVTGATIVATTFLGRPAFRLLVADTGAVIVVVVTTFLGRPALRFAGAVIVVVVTTFLGRPAERFEGAVAVAVVTTFLGRPAFRFAGAVIVVVVTTFLGRPALRFAGAVAVAEAPATRLRLTNVYPCFNRFVFKIVPHPLTNVLRLELFFLVAITLSFIFCCF